MKTGFRTIEDNRPLREAQGYLVDFDEKQSPLPLVVVRSNGSFAGLLTPTALFRSLLCEVRLDELDKLTQPELLAAMADQLDKPVSEAMVSEVSRAKPEDQLVKMMTMNAEHKGHRVEFTPVLENNIVIGIVYITEIFHAAASLALTPETEGIRLSSDKDDEIGH